MTKKIESARTRAPYAAQACIVCRAKKSKCDGVKPECGPCVASGRSDECIWGRNDKSGSSRVESYASLRKRADSLHARVLLLQSMLEKCVCQDVSFHLQARSPPEQLSGQKEPLDSEHSDTDDLDSDREITRELTVPIRRLKLDNRSGGLFHQGMTATSIVGFGRNLVKEGSRNTEVHVPQATYVLQVDENISQTHPEIDWSRYLPPEVHLSRKQHDKILDLSFKFFTNWMFRVVPALFLKDMYRALSVPEFEEPPRTPHYSPMLHNALLSICAVFSDDLHLRDIRTRQYFASAAQARLFEDIRKPNLSIVLALAFIGSFYSDKDDRVQAELFFGMSTRLSMTLGLGLDSTHWVKAGLITHDEMVGRNCAHWNIFSLDVCWALLFGREFGGPPHRDTPMPFIDPEMDQELWFYAPANIPPQPSYLTLTFNKTAALFRIARQIIDTINGLQPLVQLNYPQIEKQVAKIDLELNNWRNQLPPQLDITPTNQSQSTPQRLMLHLAYWWCSIALHRPFFCCTKFSSDVDHVKLCISAAEKILELVRTWSSLYNLRHSSLTMQQVIFSAGTIFLLRALKATAGPSIAHDVVDEALAQTEMCVEHLHEMGQTWGSAIRTAKLLHCILNTKLRPVLKRRLGQAGEDAANERKAPSQAESTCVTVPFPLAPMAMPSYTFNLDPPYSPIADEMLDFFGELQDSSTYCDSVDSLQRECLMTLPGLDLDAFLIPSYGSAWEPQDFSQHASSSSFPE